MCHLTTTTVMNLPKQNPQLYNPHSATSSQSSSTTHGLTPTWFSSSISDFKLHGRSSIKITICLVLKYITLCLFIFLALCSHHYSSAIQNQLKAWMYNPSKILYSDRNQSKSHHLIAFYSPSPLSSSSITTSTYQKTLPLNPQQFTQYLNLTSRSTLNFMHLHKTGGNAMKVLLRSSFSKRIKLSGAPVVVRGACYLRPAYTDPAALKAAVAQGVFSFDQWRCDWMPVAEQNKTERSLNDVTFGHQYLGGKYSIDVLLNDAGRQVRSFTILRHPLHRKVSFYYHFFVRERRRNESDVTINELKQFVLKEIVPPNADVGREVGPNYYTGRFLSNGTYGFLKNGTHEWYDVSYEQRDNVVKIATSILDSYLFIGLQTQPNGTLCLLHRVVQEMDKIHGISPSAADIINGQRHRRQNSGNYLLNADTLWQHMTMEERKEFEEHEWVDLKVYEHGKQLFNKQIELFGCTEQVTETRLT